MKKLISLGLCFALLSLFALAGSSRVGSVRAAAPAAPSRCTNIQLYIQAQGAQGAAGTIGIIYRLHNMWGQSCTLYGYPGIELLDRSFHSLPTTTHRGGGIISVTSPKTITIPVHGNAYFALSYSDVPVGNSSCQPAAHYIMIIPPNDNLPVVTHASMHGGSIYSCTGSIHVSPVEYQPKY